METLDSEFSWRRLPDGRTDSVSRAETVTYTRPLTGMERMYALIERSMPGHNQPFLGAHISLSPSVPSSSVEPHLPFKHLATRAREAWVQTRFLYPMVACKLQLEDRGLGTQTMYYQVEDRDCVGRWANRTFKAVVAEGGWMALREKLSVEFDLPSEVDGHGDCCFFYVIVDPTQCSSEDDNIHSFDILLHIHHALTDGPGLKSVLHALLSRVSSSTVQNEDFRWGDEALRGLMPAQVDIATEEEMAGVEKTVSEESVMAMMAGLVLVSERLTVVPPIRPK